MGIKMDIDKTKYIKMLIYQCKALKSTVERPLNDTVTMETGRFASFNYMFLNLMDWQKMF